MNIKDLKNVLIVSSGFLLLFTAYFGLANLQSSINAEKGLGVASLSVNSGCVIISSLFLSPIIIKKIGCKWTIVVSMCCYITYTLANFKPNWYGLIITSAILGFGAGPLWAAQSTYVTTAGIKYANKTGKEKTNIVNQYFGIFYLIYQLSGVFGNIISSLVFQSHVSNETLGNTSYSHCGANSCPVASLGSNNSTATPIVSENLLYILLGIYTVCEILAVLFIATLLNKIDINEEEQENISVCKSLFTTVRQLKDIRQCLLIPLTIFGGFQQAFIATEYTKAYATCTLGIQFVGYVMICFAVTNSVLSAIFGKVSEYTGRIALFMLATATSISCIIGLLLWSPNPNQLALFFIFPSLWSLSDAICQTLLTAFYGILFAENKEAAFANYKVWESVGFVIAFSYSNYFCVHVKLYVVLSIMLLGMLLYLVVEYLEARNKSANVQISSITNVQ